MNDVLIFSGEELKAKAPPEEKTWKLGDLLPKS